MTLAGSPLPARNPGWSSPVPPGPPGLNISTPGRFSGFVLAIRDTMIWICVPSGSR
ncbi:hypothetical protein ACIBP6_07100 [Nonomuraea terrae]|uniref:hypothetical protein n=1 Tax=Nonomuraea terrae TaxID=2530383 RepID=UPI003787B90E